MRKGPGSVYEVEHIRCHLWHWYFLHTR